ncbi:EAL domain-containing protein [Lacticaseibacillus thailandensis]|uniref:C-di-GMP-specific phosphodiesterase n=1 Tax=Lacticaseibacillus thailandensis DSM 22698 = JCM 13996 TaxID=1423810 RepID=A0A0R2C7R1_9LACO|nr:EAL domain-containing protein [Lacticaseibacillus thailandensis]KRM87591.1 C-di-GMP-specific phosphodiesterase [Lacticaseibacillus thailandensis DSM 22698 = JCM 13996]
MYRYFIQPQLNKINHTLIGYELLMKQYTSDGWRPPHSFASIPPHTIASVLVATTSKLALKIGSVSVNLNRTQLLNEEINHSLMRAQNYLRPLRLNIELTEELADAPITIAQMRPMLTAYVNRGMQICLDDVGSGENQLDHVLQLVPYASEIKFALQNFNVGLDDPKMRAQVKFWRDFAYQRGLRFILEGVENAHDDALVDALRVTLRQGYFYGKPKLLKLDVSDPDQ